MEAFAAQSLATVGLSLMGFAALACLCLSMQRHARHETVRALLWQRRELFRSCGWLLLLTTTLFAIWLRGWGLGLVTLAGIASGAALVVIGLNLFRPYWLLLLIVPCCLLGLVCSLWLNLPLPTGM